MANIIGTDNYQVYVNIYQPKTDYKMYVRDYAHQSVV